MEKLELKHLGAYLPYGLKIQYQFDTKTNGVETRVGVLQGLNKPYYNVEAIIMTVYIDAVKLDSREIKPILRPLSDLTKVIEHNGEKLIPIDFINGDFSCEIPKKIEWNQSVRNENLHFVLAEWISPKNLYALFELLFKWHFDIFGLIEKGLAVDINTLQGK